MFTVFLILALLNRVSSEITPQDLEFLNELPLDKLVRLRNSLQELVTLKHDNTTLPEPTYLQRFGAQALPIQAPSIKRTDYSDDVQKKDGHTKISSIFSMSVTTLAFLAFGGYLLCLIVQAVRSKQNISPPAVPQPTFFVSSGIKKRPKPQFASYGRRKRDNRSTKKSDADINIPPEKLFAALLQLCEGYVKWSRRHGNF